MIPIPPSVPFTVHVIALKHSGDPAVDAGAFVITSSNPSCCDVTPNPGHPGDSTWAVGAPGTEGAFVLNATDGLHTGASDELLISDGAAPLDQVEIRALGPDAVLLAVPNGMVAPAEAPTP